MKRRREKSNSSTLSFIMAALEARKKVNLAITLLKIRLDTYICICIQERDEKKIYGARKVIPAVIQRKQYIYMINSSTLYGRI